MRLHHSSVQNPQLLPISIRVKVNILTKAFKGPGDRLWCAPSTARSPLYLSEPIHFWSPSFLHPLQLPWPLCRSLNTSSCLWGHMTNSLTSFCQSIHTNIFSMNPTWPPYFMLQPILLIFPVLLTKLPSYFSTTDHLTNYIIDYVYSYLSAPHLILRGKIHRARTFYLFCSPDIS